MTSQQVGGAEGAVRGGSEGGQRGATRVSLVGGGRHGHAASADNWGEPNSSVVKRLIKGLMAAWSPNGAALVSGRLEEVEAR
eukprot:779943-Prorocentrum_minimum.AAC.1